MKILYIHQYFCTRKGKSGTRSYEFSKYLVQRGHQVTMITGTSALSGADGVADGIVSRSCVEGINVVAIRVPYSQRMGWSRRILSFLEFMLISTWIACRERKHDIILATSTPLTVGVPGMVASVLRQTPLVFEVRDLWPEVPIQLGVIRNRGTIKLLRWLERLIYRRSRRIIALSPGICEGVLSAGVSRERVDTIPNCSDLDLFRPGPVDKRGLAEWNLAGTFLVTHAGSVGFANGLDVVLEAAEVVLREGWVDVRFMLLGEGAESALLRRQAEAQKLQNIIFAGGVPREQVARFLRASDVCLVLFRPVPVLGTNSPNKLFDALAAGRPVIVNTMGWMRALVEHHGVGLAADPGSGRSLAAMICTLRENRSWCEAMGRRARQLAETEFDRRTLAVRFERSLLRASHHPLVVPQARSQEPEDVAC